VEWEEVYVGAFYGTLESEIERLWAIGKHVLFDVDVKGGLKLKEYYGDKALAVFVRVPNEEILRQRLIGRGTETEDSLSKRLFKVHFEMSFENQFDVVLVNDDLETSFQKAQKLVDDFVIHNQVPEKGAVL
jgi:guanylate kinase